MSFQDNWVAMILQCIRTISYSIMVNSEPKGLIHPSRGLRQGDHLSPFLFLFYAEGLNALFSQAARNGEIQGYSIYRARPKITHLFFADDCLLFSRATSSECEKIQNILAWYEATSRQQVNSDKTTAFFSRNTFEEIQGELQVLLGVSVIRSY